MNLHDKRIAVTGASGMLGVYLARALIAAGACVRGVVRNPKKAAFLEREGVEFATADLDDRESLREAFRGCDAIVSNAALYSVKNSRWQDHYKANKEGTENVYEAAASAAVPRVVQISTFGVYRWHLGAPAIDDDSPLIDGERKQGGAYSATKQISEALAFSISRKHGIATTALRPAGIYGARDSNLMPYIRGMLRFPLLPIPRFRFPFVYAGDVADAMVGALRNDASRDHAYLIAGRSDTLFDFVAACKQAEQKKTWLVPIPIGGGFRIDTSRAEREIGFKNRSYLDGLRDTFEADRRHRDSA
jgi:nucleoside-diphosphate-sugar epimerase